MDRAHRDRLAFVRVCSGRFSRGMVVTHADTGRPFATKYAQSVFGRDGPRSTRPSPATSSASSTRTPCASRSRRAPWAPRRDARVDGRSRRQRALPACAAPGRRRGVRQRRRACVPGGRRGRRPRRHHARTRIARSPSPCVTSGASANGRPRARDRGRGTEIMRRLTTEFARDSTPSGTTVRFRVAMDVATPA